MKTKHLLTCAAALGLLVSFQTPALADYVFARQILGVEIQASSFSLVMGNGWVEQLADDAALLSPGQTPVSNSASFLSGSPSSVSIPQAFVGTVSPIPPPTSGMVGTSVLPYGRSDVTASVPAQFFLPPSATIFATGFTQHTISVFPNDNVLVAEANSDATTDIETSATWVVTLPFAVVGAPTQLQLLAIPGLVLDAFGAQTSSAHDSFVATLTNAAGATLFTWTPDRLNGTVFGAYPLGSFDTFSGGPIFSPLTPALPEGTYAFKLEAGVGVFAGVSVVPEPPILAITAIGILAVLGRAWRRRSAAIRPS